MSPGPSPSADWTGLRDAREAEQLGGYLRGLWERRDYMWYVAGAELRSRQINSLLGNLWHLINPALQIGVFFVIFGLVLEIDRGVDNFLGYLAVGVFTFQFTQKAVTVGARSLLRSRGLIQLVSFPRAVIPITTTITETLASLPTFLVMFVAAAATGEPPSLLWFFVIPVILLQTILSAGLALIAARATSHVPDVLQVLPFVFRLGFYGSGVLFNVNVYVEDSAWRLLFELNPLYCFIEINRSLILDGRTVDWSLVLIACVWAFGAAVLGFTFFRAGEDSYGEA